MTHLSLFSGIGGLDLAAEWAGFKTVGQCEWADYPTKILEKHWPDIPRWRDIRTLNKDDFYARTGLRTVDVISGGFPCQPFSVAGKRRGKEDDRYLWPEMLRVIHELQPSWVVGENVAGIVTLALDQVLSDLENIGYTCQAFIIPACGVDAPHRRNRCAIVACTDNGYGARGVADKTRTEINGNANSYAQSIRLQRCGSWKTLDARLQSARREPISLPAARTGGPYSAGENWAAEPDVGRVANGIPNRVDRLKCLGNAVAPQQFYPIFKAIADIGEAI